MYLLKKIVNLGRSSEKRAEDDDVSPREDSLSKDENSTSQDVSELSESLVSDEVAKTRKFDSEDEDWLPDGDAPAQESGLVSRKFDSEDENWLPAEGSEKKGEDLNVKGKKKKRKKRSKRGDKNSESESLSETVSKLNSEEREKSVESEKKVVARKFDSEDEQWLSENHVLEETKASSESVSSKSVHESLENSALKLNAEEREKSEECEKKVVARKFDSEDEQWLSENHVLEETKASSDSVSSKSVQDHVIKFDSESEVSKSRTDDEIGNIEDRVKSSLENIPRKFDSEDEQWLSETGVNDAEDRENSCDNVLQNSEKEQFLESKGVAESENDENVVTNVARKFDSEDEDWLQNDDPPEVNADAESCPSPKEKSLSPLSPKTSAEREVSPKTSGDRDVSMGRSMGRDDSSQRNEERDGSTKRSVERDDSTKRSPEKDGSSQRSVERDGSSQRSSERDGSSQRSAERDGSSQRSAERGSSTKRSSERDGSSQRSAERDVLSQRSAERGSSTKRSSERDGSSQRNLKKDRSTKCSAERDGSSQRSVERDGSSQRSAERDVSSKKSTDRDDISPKTSTEPISHISLQNAETEDDEYSPDNTTDNQEPTDSTSGSSSGSESGTSIESSHASSPDEKPTETPEDVTSPPHDELKQVHQRNFAKALQDIGTQPRRRSVLIPDQRERIVQQERSYRLSESSTDGETAHDDGIIDFLGKENDRAEARLAARRQARVEAREIRMRELERVQKEQEQSSDKVFDHHTPARQPSMSPRERPTSTNSYHSSRRSSEDSMEDGIGLRDLRHELKEVEEKFRKAMIANAQLDNEKAAHAYQVELLKDKLEDLEEAHSLLGREHRERCREHEALKRATLKLKEELTICRMQLEERDRLIADYGLIIVGGDINEKGEVTPRELVSNQAAEVLESAGEGSLDVRLKNLAKDKNELVDEVRHLKLELEDERTKRQNEQSLTNGPLSDDVVQTLNDYRFRLQKSEQETSTLQATVARLESQVIRYKSAAEESEKAEDELKTEKRKLLREHRESLARIEELETSNSHLQRRMDKLKNAKSTLLKEL